MCAFTNTVDRFCCRNEKSKKNFPIFAFSLSEEEEENYPARNETDKKWMKIPKLRSFFCSDSSNGLDLAKEITSDVSLSHRPRQLRESSSFVRPMILAPSWQLAKCFQAQLEVSETGEVESHHKRLMTLSGFLLLPELYREFQAIGTAEISLS